MTYREYKTDKYIVRVHPGKLTEEQLREVLENAARDFFRAIQKANPDKVADIIKSRDEMPHEH